MGVRLREGILDVGLGLRLLTPRTQSPDSGRGADAERKRVQEGVRGMALLRPACAGLRRAPGAGNFFPRLRPRRGHGAGCEGSNMRRLLCDDL